MRRDFAILALVALLALGGCTGVDFVIPEPVQKEEGSENTQKPSEPNEEPEEPSDMPTDPDTPTDTPTTPSNPTDTPSEPTYSAKVKWVASVEDLEKLTIVVMTFQAVFPPRLKGAESNMSIIGISC